jgi:hypothetical protein
MVVYIINGRPHTSVSNGFLPIDYITYQLMIERSEIEKMEVIEHD